MATAYMEEISDLKKKLGSDEQVEIEKGKVGKVVAPEKLRLLKEQDTQKLNLEKKWSDAMEKWEKLERIKTDKEEEPEEVYNQDVGNARKMLNPTNNSRKD